MKFRLLDAICLVLILFSCTDSHKDTSCRPGLSLISSHGLRFLLSEATNIASDSNYVYFDLAISRNDHKDVIAHCNVLHASDFMAFDFGKFIRIPLNGKNLSPAMVHLEGMLDQEGARHLLLSFEKSVLNRQQIDLQILPNSLVDFKVIIPYTFLKKL